MKKLKTNVDTILKSIVSGKKLASKTAKGYFSLLVAIVMLMSTGCTSSDINTEDYSTPPAQVEEQVSVDETSEEDASKEDSSDDLNKENEEDKKDDSTVAESQIPDDLKDMFEGYRLIEVDGGDLSGNREPNVVVDIGFGDREYWAFTNQYGQLTKVYAKKVVLQNDQTEPVNSKGRYYNDEAKVPGTERSDLDEGHVIADSLGGVSNAYNITPQNSTLNRHGDQAYMEKVIRDAGGCTDFVAIITYPDTKTQIPSHYSYTYTINGRVIKDEFDNVNPEKTTNNTNTTTNNKTNGATNNTGSGATNTATNNNTTGNTQTNTNNSAKVYYTPGGKSYHTTKSCRTLSRSKTILEGTIKESGKTDPCDVCH